MAGELHAFLSDNNKSHLQKASALLESAIGEVSGLPIVATSADADRLVSSVEELRSRSIEILDDLGERVQSVKAEVESADSRLTAMDSQLGEVKAEISNQKARLDQAISDFQTQFSESEDRRRQSFETAQEEAVEKSERALASGKENLAEVAAKLAERSSTAISTLEEKKQEAIELVQVIGNVGVTGNFKTIADGERTAANWFRGCTSVHGSNRSRCCLDDTCSDGARF